MVEEHKDKYPHVHVILQYPNACLRLQHSKWFDRKLYALWKSLWRHGVSDYQAPRGKGTAVLSYVMKYCLKNATSSTVWKKVLPKEDYSDYVVSADDQDQSDPPRERTINTHSVTPVKKYGVKYLTWSRNFDFNPFIVENSNKPCPKRGLSTHLTFNNTR